MQKTEFRSFGTGQRKLLCGKIPSRPGGGHGKPLSFTFAFGLCLHTIIARPAKRNKEFTGEYTKPNTTATPHRDSPAGGSGDAASLTTNEAEKSVLANATFSSIAQTTHVFQTRAGEAHDIVSLIDTPRSQPDTKKCIQVGSETYAVMSQPRSPYTSQDYDSISVIDSSSSNVPVHSGEYTPTHESTVEGHRRKKNKTGKTKHSRTPAGARRQK